MTRNILSIAVLGVFFGLGSTAFSADPAGKAQTGEISNDMLAQLGLGSSSLVTDEEGETIRGKAKKKRTKQDGTIYRADFRKKTEANAVAKKIRKKISKKNQVTFKKQKFGRYTSRYRVHVRKAKGKKVKTTGKTNFSPTTRFNVL